MNSLPAHTNQNSYCDGKTVLTTVLKIIEVGWKKATNTNLNAENSQKTTQLFWYLAINTILIYPEIHHWTKNNDHIILRNTDHD